MDTDSLLTVTAKVFRTLTGLGILAVGLATVFLLMRQPKGRLDGVEKGMTPEAVRKAAGGPTCEKYGCLETGEISWVYRARLACGPIEVGLRATTISFAKNVVVSKSEDFIFRPRWRWN